MMMMMMIDDDDDDDDDDDNDNDSYQFPERIYVSWSAINVLLFFFKKSIDNFLLSLLRSTV